MQSYKRGGDVPIDNPRWADADHATILATVDGAEVSIPADVTNRHYRDLIASGMPIAPHDGT